MRVHKPVAAVVALAGCVVFKELHRFFAFGALHFEYGPRFPVPAVLSRALHGEPSYFGNLILDT